MARDVDAVVGPYGWATRAELIRRVHRGPVDAWVAQGKLIRLDDGVYATPRTAARWRAVAGAPARTRGGVVSHSSALALWELVEPPRGPLHLTVAGSRSGRGSADVVLHRGSELHETVRRIEGIPVTCVERAVVDTWGCLGIYRGRRSGQRRSTACAGGSAGPLTWRTSSIAAAGSQGAAHWPNSSDC